MADPPVDEIQILLAEYNTLRAELLQRNTTSFQALGVAGTAFAAIIIYAFTASIFRGIVLLIVLILLVYLVLRIFDFDTRNAAARLCELEVAINSKAGSKLLAWESDRGLLSPGAKQKRINHIVGPPLRLWQVLVTRLWGRENSN